MDWLTFVAQIVNTLVWPATITIAVLLLRKPIGQLIQTLRFLRYRDLSLEFGKKLEQLEATADQAQLPAAETAPERAPRLHEESLSEYIERLASISPRAAIAEAWRHLELALREVVTRAGQREPRSLRGLWRFFETEQTLPAEAVSMLQDLSALRNQAVHASDFDLAPEQAAEFGRIAERIIAVLRPED
ncbi:MAG: hypothetical protein ACE5IQ_05635 [Candidatus Methylomirabilales bacterium]